MLSKKEIDSPDFLINAESPESALKIIFGQNTSIVSKTPIYGGDINKASKIITNKGNFFFLKENNSEFTNMLYKEALGLLEMKTKNGPIVPSPIAWGQNNKTQFLIMIFFANQTRTNDFYEELGRRLAFFHQKENETFGLAYDNYIGSIIQKNTQEKSWTTFFAENRIRFQLSLLKEKNLLNHFLLDKTEHLIEKIKTIIEEPKKPSLLHGDLWSGNVISSNEGYPVIIDPAIYYGHPEADLSMTEMFSRLDQRFYDAYKEITPIDKYYSVRKNVYNLYHYLNHLNLFGKAYLASVQSTIKYILNL